MRRCQRSWRRQRQQAVFIEPTQGLSLQPGDCKKLSKIMGIFGRRYKILTRMPHGRLPCASSGLRKPTRLPSWYLRRYQPPKETEPGGVPKSQAGVLVARQNPALGAGSGFSRRDINRGAPSCLDVANMPALRAVRNPSRALLDLPESLACLGGRCGFRRRDEPLQKVDPNLYVAP